MYSSNSLRFTNFFFPTNNTHGQLGVRNSLSIRFIPMLLYAAASLTVREYMRVKIELQENFTVLLTSVK